MNKIMGGWKTWVCRGRNGRTGRRRDRQRDVESGITKLVAAFGLIGIGNKLDKAAKAGG